MPLPSSGTLSISQIRNEVVAQGYPSSYSLLQLSTYAGFSAPHSISDFYGWPPCPPYGTYTGQYCEGCYLYYQYANGTCGYYSTLQGYDPFCGPGCASGSCCDCGFGCDCGYLQDCFVYGCFDCIN